MQFKRKMTINGKFLWKHACRLIMPIDKVIICGKSFMTEWKNSENRGSFTVYGSGSLQSFLQIKLVCFKISYRISVLGIGNEPYLLFACTSYLISCSVHGCFASVIFIVCKWRWGCTHFKLYVFQYFGIKQSS